MSLLFGNLTQDFVTFGEAVSRAQSGDATAPSEVLSAAAHFRHTAANDATYLVYIGELSHRLNFKFHLTHISQQVSVCLRARLFSCISGCTLPRSMQSGSAKGI